MVVGNFLKFIYLFLNVKKKKSSLKKKGTAQLIRAASQEVSRKLTGHKKATSSLPPLQQSYLNGSLLNVSPPNTLLVAIVDM